MISEIKNSGAVQVRGDRIGVLLTPDEFYLNSWIDYVQACGGSRESRGAIRLQLIGCKRIRKIKNIYSGGCVVSFQSLKKYGFVKGVMEDGETLWIKREIRE